jgi:hypothetical protein
MPGTFTIELCREGGPDSGVEAVLEAAEDLATARGVYRSWARRRPDRVILLCIRARILARSDEPDSMPQ